MGQENENNKPQIIMGGVSGNKELRVRRVHKKNADTGDAAAKAEPKTAAPKTAAPAEEKPKAAPAAEAKPKATKTAAAENQRLQLFQ